MGCECWSRTTRVATSHRAQTVGMFDEILCMPPRGHDPAHARVTRDPLLLQRFAVLGNVETFQFLLARNPQRNEDADQFQERVGQAGGPDEGDPRSAKLDEQLLWTALDQTRCFAD